MAKRLRLEFKAQDAWIGAFWKRGTDRFDLWVCLVPCFPLHYSSEHPHE